MRAGQRAGFTLVELLVVIAIISILVALIGVAIFAALRQGPDALARQEIAQLGNAIESCKASLAGVGNPLPYLPSSLTLREDNNYQPADAATVAFLKKAFPGIDLTLATVAGGKGAGIDWNGDGTISVSGTTPMVLEGEQCLVFWLGGIKGTMGFNNNPTNPGNLGGPTFRPTYYTFPLNRLAPGSNGFPIFVDPYNSGKPYLYFSSGKAGNDYTLDCPSFGVSPYKSLSGQFINPKGFQIICAGKDGFFGPGDVWNGWGQSNPNNGSDDLANFSSTVLALPPN
jgi:prepilin-type N-terminal cleavage/methylation domain-containing protein